MKKIGIITIVDNNNYGNRLQNYAVHKVYGELGYSCETLQLNQRKESKKYLFRAWKMFYKPIEKQLKRDKLEKQRFEKFKNFTMKYVPTKEKFFWNNKIKEEYDYFSVGSDQIWNSYLDFGYLTEFLSFARPEQRLTFSPSFGTDNIKQSKIENFRKGLSGFNNISVRESAGAKIVKELTGKNASVLIDPTMMLDAKDWLQIAKKPKNIDFTKSYILTYFLGGRTKKIEEDLNKYSKKENMNVYHLLDKEQEELFVADPSEFIYLVSKAKMIMTDSFHACVFSLLFNKAFLVYDRSGAVENMMSRIETLLEKFNLQRKYVNSGIENDPFENDYKLSYKILENERRNVIDFLQKSLKKGKC